MSLWGFARPVLLAVAIAPALTIVVGLLYRFVTGQQSLKDTGLVLVGSPLVYAVYLLLSAIPALVVVALSAGGMTALLRIAPMARVLLWVVAAACLGYMWIAMNRYPNGDGGSMQSLSEQIKATCAAGVAIWCVLAARAGS